jgi:hypothetical protein
MYQFDGYVKPFISPTIMLPLFEEADQPLFPRKSCIVTSAAAHSKKKLALIGQLLFVGY